MKAALIAVSLAQLNLLSRNVDAHSWVINVGRDGGRSRGGAGQISDLILQRYFCPLPNLADCQPNPKHGVVLGADTLRPCRANVESNPAAVVRAGEDLYLSWAGNGHVNNGQSDGTCVKVMLADYDADPDFADFVTLAGASCLPYWRFDSSGNARTYAEVPIPPEVVPGKYTVLWYWDFTDFIFSSCADIHVIGVSDPDPTAPPSAITPTYPTAPVNNPPVQAPITDVTIGIYMNSGCQVFPDGGDFCRRYMGSGSYCKDYQSDSCGRSVCQGGDFLLPCNNGPVPAPIPVPAPVPVPAPIPAPVPVPVSNLSIYLSSGCNSSALPTSFCSNQFGTYCKDWQADGCGRSVCQGQSHSSMTAC